jgi:hypothetical protein
LAEPDFPIMPSTKVAALLEHFPELEDVLIETAPPFKKLKNPLLRRSVAKVASLQHAAAVARIPLADLLNKLRSEVGQDPIAADQVGDAPSYCTEQPDWFDASKVAVSINEEEAENPNEMPLVTVLKEANRLEDNEIVELITDFLPAPGIDIMKQKGFLAWTIEEKPDLFKTYFTKGSTK